MMNWFYEVDFKNLSIPFIKFDKRYERLNDITLMQTFNLSSLSNDEIDKLALKLQEFKRASFQHVNRVL